MQTVLAKTETILSTIQGSTPRDTAAIFAGVIASLLASSAGTTAETVEVLKGIIDTVAKQESKIENLRFEGCPDEED